MISNIIHRASKSLSFRFCRQMDRLKRVVRVNFPQAGVEKIEFVEQFSPQDDSEYDLYQKYYENSLRELVHFRKTKAVDLFAPHTTHVGQYLFHLRCGAVRKVAIDAHDNRNIRSQAIYDWSDIYFKSNRWPSVDYGPKVLSIITGNAGITLENCRFLSSLRSVKKEYDLVFVGRIWAGGDANVEHNLRLFESLAKVNCKSKLLAVVFNFDKDGEDFLHIRERLEKAGVEWTENQIGYGKLMELSAKSKLVVIRAGISGCISWRIVDMLGIGACIVLDREPFPKWPVPLKDGENFVSLGIGITDDCKPASMEDYDIIGKNISENKCYKTLLLSNQKYFADYIVPAKCAQYIIKIIIKYSSN